MLLTILVDFFSLHYGKSQRNHSDENALNVTLGPCGCNVVAGNNEEEPSACDQPAPHSLLSNTPQTTAWQHFNPHKAPDSLLSQQTSFHSKELWAILTYFTQRYRAKHRSTCSMVTAGPYFPGMPTLVLILSHVLHRGSGHHLGLRWGSWLWCEITAPSRLCL